MNEVAVEVISVAELDRRLRRAVERVTGREWIEGEVASLRRAGSGHVYFLLKDEREEAVIDCVMYRLQAQRARRWLIDGARLQLSGRATVWAPRGRLQFVAEVARPAGRGALLEALERLKEKLLAEGLFDPERKRPLPPEARVVGVVTSAHGAAFRDIVTVGFRRGGARIVLSPALVQGEGAAQSIERAVDLIERYPGLDVLIVGRGGGSGEDLMAFNDERLVRRLAEVRVPLVSAVGHEIDVTLTDRVADVRAATPSQAAELVFADFASRSESLRRFRAALNRAARGRLMEDRSAVERLRAKLSDPRFLIAEKQQCLDELEGRLGRCLLRTVARRRNELERLTPRLLSRHPRAVVARSRGRLAPLSARLQSAMRRRLQSASGEMGRAAGRLDALSPLSVLERGYAIATRADGSVLRAAGDAAPGDLLRLRLHRGRLEATVVTTEDEQV